MTDYKPYFGKWGDKISIPILDSLVPVSCEIIGPNQNLSHVAVSILADKSIHIIPTDTFQLYTIQNSWGFLDPSEFSEKFPNNTVYATHRDNFSCKYGYHGAPIRIPIDDSSVPLDCALIGPNKYFTLVAVTLLANNSICVLPMETFEASFAKMNEDVRAKKKIFYDKYPLMSKHSVALPPMEGIPISPAYNCQIMHLQHFAEQVLLEIDTGVKKPVRYQVNPNVFRATYVSVMIKKSVSVHDFIAGMQVSPDAVATLTN